MGILQSFYELHQSSQWQLTGFSFLFLMLPLFLFVYYVVPPRFRPAVLLAESLLYYLLAARAFFPIIVPSVLLDYVLLQLMGRLETRPAARRICLLVSIGKSLVLFLWTGLSSHAWEGAPVLGLRIYTLLSIGCMLDAYRKEFPAQQGLIPFALHCTYFPRIYATQPTHYRAFTDQLGKKSKDYRFIFSGFGTFVHGLFKAAVLGTGLFALFLQTSRLHEVTVLSSWLQVLALALAVFHIFSGYDAISRGLSSMYGISLPRNFYYPYQSRSIADFFGRFNLLLHRFLRENIYDRIPGKEKRPLLHTLLILACGALAGLWFDLTPNALLWGVFLTVFLLLERHVYRRLFAYIPTLFARLITLVIVLVSFPLFSAETPALGFLQMRALFQFDSLYSESALYLLSSNWLLLLAGCLLATNLVHLVVVKLRRSSSRLPAVVLGASYVWVLLLFVMLRF